ncbi:MAG: hypothetical protein HLUCCO18_03085 [Rhodobacteraceae bacterium HLUCCO18]|nr:MAG: hypothetical protein HLUCCO18_03085 [Rhodobacteraceae bacterium HLUCCO18]
MMASIRIPGKAKATMDKTEWLLSMAIDAFGSRPITEVTAPVILDCLRRVEAKGNYETARRLRSKIGAVSRPYWHRCWLHHVHVEASKPRLRDG